MAEAQPPSANADNIAAWSAITRAEIEAFGDEGDFARRHLITPTLLALLGDVDDLDILDAGAGTGYLSRLLARQGARMTALEPVEPLVRYVQDRETAEPLGVTIIQEDLSQMTRFSDHFDVVIANLVLLDIPDFQRAMHNCIQAVKPGGAFIFSLEHPSFSSADKTERPYRLTDYFTPTATQRAFGHNYRRTLETYIDILTDNGMFVERIKEPQLAASIAAQHPSHAWGHDLPAFIFIKAIKTSA